MKKLFLIVCAAAIGAYMTNVLWASQTKLTSLPKGFRMWPHTKSMVIPDKSHGLYGFHNIYANQAALQTLARKGSYPNGATFVASFYEVVEKDGTVNQGAKIMDAVMVKDSRAKETGGWIYAAFDPRGKPKPINAAKDCFECHKSVKNNDYVFHELIR